LNTIDLNDETIFKLKKEQNVKEQVQKNKYKRTFYKRTLASKSRKIELGILTIKINLG